MGGTKKYADPTDIEHYYECTDSGCVKKQCGYTTLDCQYNKGWNPNTNSCGVYEKCCVQYSGTSASSVCTDTGTNNFDSWKIYLNSEFISPALKMTAEKRIVKSCFAKSFQ